MKLTGKEIVLGVTGGIAAYKSAEVVSRLRKQGAQVHVIMTENATKFVAPLTFETLSNHPVVTDTFARPDTWEVEHIALAKRAELFAIAPATANILAKLAWGLADDMLSTTALATRAPMLVAPAMNVGMWEAEATRQNMATLRQRGVHVVGPGERFPGLRGQRRRAHGRAGGDRRGHGGHPVPTAGLCGFARAGHRWSHPGAAGPRALPE